MCERLCLIPLFLRSFLFSLFLPPSCFSLHFPIPSLRLRLFPALFSAALWAQTHYVSYLLLHRACSCSAAGFFVFGFLTSQQEKRAAGKQITKREGCVYSVFLTLRCYQSCWCRSDRFSTHSKLRFTMFLKQCCAAFFPLSVYLLFDAL